MASNVSIATRPLVYSTFRYINNKVWNALAEYIDNSIQSFEDHRNELKCLNVDGKLHVRIDIDFINDKITILDDAYGITEQNYQRAFELANLPLDNQGLNEFGMGMKVSSIWLSNTWSVETSAYGEPIRKTMVFDLQEVVDREEMELPVLEEECDKGLHYTKITLSNLSMNKPTTRQMSYIKKHLASIYTKYLRDKTIEIILNDELLHYTELKVLEAPHYSKPNGPVVEWRKDILFEGKIGNKIYSVKGFIGVLETMSTSENNGFLLFRRGRVIGTSYDDRYRPKALCGQEGSPQYKRIFGELHLEGFDVSFTKNSFQEDDDFSMFIELLKEDLNRDKALDLFGQAQNYTKPKSKTEIKTLGANLVNQIARGFTKPNTGPIQTSTQHVTQNNVSSNSGTQQPENEQPSHSVENKPIPQPDLFGNTVSLEDFQIPSATVDVPLSNGKIVKLTIRGERGISEQGLYNLTIASEDNFVATINLRNPIFSRFDKSLSTQEGQEQLAYIIEVMVATEISLSQGGEQGGTYFRNQFNSLFGAI